MKKGGIVFSTNKNLHIEEEECAVSKNDFTVSVCFEKKGRAGKGVTIIRGIEEDSNTLKSLAKEIKKTLSIGGSNKNGEIILQGRIQEKVIGLLNKKGYQTKKVGG
jgi:translation initiation factor 1